MYKTDFFDSSIQIHIFKQVQKYLVTRLQTPLCTYSPPAEASTPKQQIENWLFLANLYYQTLALNIIIDQYQKLISWTSSKTRA
jgi:hypothetical protein